LEALDAKANTPIVVRIESTGTGMINHVVFKGFEIDAQDPTRQAGKHDLRFFYLDIVNQY